MRILRCLAPPALLAACMWAQSSAPTLSGSCRNGGAYPGCVGGEIVFTGGTFTDQVHVQVTNSAGEAIDDGNYATTNGVLTFVENLSFADTYTITVNDQVMLTVSTQ